MRKKIVTNNPLVQEKYGGEYPVEMVEGGYKDVLLALRDAIHRGAVLLTHPLSGSVKPGETPYKSVLIDDKTGPLDFNSLELIENSLAAYEKFHPSNAAAVDRVRQDFQLVDYTLISSALR
jgi:hypothetical protein